VESSCVPADSQSNEELARAVFFHSAGGLGAVGAGPRQQADRTVLDSRLAGARLQPAPRRT